MLEREYVKSALRQRVRFDPQHEDGDGLRQKKLSDRSGLEQDV